MPDPAPPPLLALCGGSVVISLDPPAVVRDDLLLAGGRVASVGPAPGGVPRRDCSGTLIVPGNVCAHHHLYSALARAMPYALTPPADFTEILQRVWWRLDRALDEESVRASALRGGLDALLSGTTSIVDHHASPNFIDGSLDVIAESLGALGVRSVLCYEVTDRDGPTRAAAGIEENRRFAGRTGPLWRAMVGAHASFTLSDDTLAACADAAIDAGVGVHIHVAEDDVDQQDSLARSGQRVVQRLTKAGITSDKALLAHCVHVDDTEVALVDAQRATVVCNPRSNMNNGVGYSPFHHHDGPVALGTDGIGGDMFSESRDGFFRAKEADVRTAGSWPLERLAEGARFVGRAYGEPGLGTLAPGAPADLCVLAYEQSATVDDVSLAGHWVFGLSPARVRDVYVAGVQVVADGRSTRVDEAEVGAREAGVCDRLWRRLEQTPAHCFEPQGRHRP